MGRILCCLHFCCINHNIHELSLCCIVGTKFTLFWIFALRVMTHNEMDIEGASTRERYNNFMEESCCTQFCTGPNPSMARYVYGLMFLVTSLLAWTVRDYGHAALAELQRKCFPSKQCILSLKFYWQCL